MARLAVKKGGKLETIAGLAGLGDRILTCTGELSRNRMLGFRVAQGEKVEDALGNLEGVAEGYRTAKSVFELAGSLAVEVPICEQVYRVLYEGRPAKQAVQALLQRPLGPEWEPPS
jgi:glycerol-3-phosphate dehydrogenase (NAD(P)+)